MGQSKWTANRFHIINFIFQKFWSKSSKSSLRKPFIFRQKTKGKKLGTLFFTPIFSFPLSCSWCFTQFTRSDIKIFHLDSSNYIYSVYSSRLETSQHFHSRTPLRKSLLLYSIFHGHLHKRHFAAPTFLIKLNRLGVQNLERHFPRLTRLKKMRIKWTEDRKVASKQNVEPIIIIYREW